MLPKIFFICIVFFSGDIVTAAGGNYTAMAATGGVVAIHIKVKIANFVEAIHTKISSISLSWVAYDNF